MTSVQRCLSVLACAWVLALVVLAGVAWTPWALVVSPIPVVLGLAAWRGITPAQVWRHLGDESDQGAGPAGWWP